MILLDWTRMGKSYCLAGAVAEHGGYRVVRPLLVNAQREPYRNAGWAAFLLDGHARWEVFELLGVEAPPPEPPHLEDVWVRAMRPRRRMATQAERLAVLAATQPADGDSLFGADLTPTHTAAHLAPGTGCRSLTTVLVSVRRIAFSVAQREGVAQPDIRATLPLPEVGERTLPVKDHFLLRRAEQSCAEPTRRAQALQDAVGRMGERVAVRLGLSRAFQGNPGRAPACCWLMADGFFSLTDPQP
jgi:hypothetical protein